MNCSICGEPSTSEVNFCRKCGASLKQHAPDDTSVITRPIVKEEMPFFPQTGAPVVSLKKDSNDEKETVKQPGKSEMLGAIQSSTLPEESLSFTVDKDSFKDVPRKALEARGLLTLKDTYRVSSGGLWEGDMKISTVIDKHVELMFAKNDSYIPQSEEWNALYGHGELKPKFRISFKDIESVMFKRGLLKSKMIIKLKPERDFSRLLKIDPISREVILYVSQRESKLAKRIQSTIMLEVSNLKLERFVKGL
jgi:hypothetical protein